ncbi:hypothetical protein VNO77_04150 [Canavalia gladiata]|uniref:Uncharacterized protein n=1 Tax=Canavalia gladiata TaxID=3824 RepID=A0AAN9MW07_CANGL
MEELHLHLHDSVEDRFGVNEDFAHQFLSPPTLPRFPKGPHPRSIFSIVPKLYPRPIQNPQSPKWMKPSE